MVNESKTWRNFLSPLVQRCVQLGHRYPSIALISLAALLSYCSSLPLFSESLRQSYSDEDLKTLNPADLETVAIAGLNDFHGALLAEERMTRESTGENRQLYSPGGASILASHLKILRNEWGPQLLVLDAGDHLQGSLDADLLEGKPIVELYNMIGMQAATLGLTDFNLPENVLRQRLEEAKYPYVSTSLSGLPNNQPSVLLSTGNLTVGVVAMNSPALADKLKKEKYSKVHTHDAYPLLKKEIKNLHEKGAHFIVLLAHMEVRCANHLVKSAEDDYQIYRPQTVQGVCDRDSEIAELLYSLPQGSVDLVVAGGSHRIVHHWINNIPVIQGGAGGLYYNLAYLTYDRKQRKIIPSLTRIEGPIALCSKVFSKQNHCNGQSLAPIGGRGPQVDAIFRGQKVSKDWMIERSITELTKPTAGIKGRKIALAERPIRHSALQESELGNLIADALREKTQSDFAFIHPGLIRKGLDKGMITYFDLHRSIPNDSHVVVMELTGAEIRKIMEIANNGARGFYSISGLKLEVQTGTRNLRWRDLNGDGKTQHWEVDRLQRLRTTEDKSLADHRNYRVATIDYLAQGGDDLEWIMNKISPKKIAIHQADSLRDLVAEYLTESLASDQAINTMKNPLVDPARPRLVLKSQESGKNRR